jgi:NADH-quinone oxidoreductase subunit C
MSPLKPEDIRDRLASVLGGSLELSTIAGDPFVMVPPEKWVLAAKTLRNDPDIFCDYLRSQSGVDRPTTEKIEVVIHVFSYKHRHAFVLKTQIDRKNPTIETISNIWPAANWYERELYDLFGIKVIDHPDLRRLLLPDDWVGHPLLKDYKEQPSYQGISTLKKT